MMEYLIERKRPVKMHKRGCLSGLRRICRWFLGAEKTDFFDFFEKEETDNTDAFF